MMPFPPAWASGFGDDEFGIWADLSYREVTQRLRWIAPGEFWMGSPQHEEGRGRREGPRHRVLITEGFWLADSACTQTFWLAVVGKNPSEFRSPENPVDQVSWNDITKLFLPELQSLLGNAMQVELPSEAQWEYACRAGTDTVYSFGNHINATLANFGSNARETLPVSRYPANGWGLMQMHGNVWEWCRDGLRQYTNAAVINPAEPSDSLCAVRGGSWFHVARLVRSAYRYAYSPDVRTADLGFRFSLRPVSPERAMRSEKP